MGSTENFDTEETKDVAEETAETVETEKETAEETAEKTAQAEASEENEASAEPKEKKSKKKKEKVDERDEKIAMLNDSLLRQRAEFENFRKRSEKEKAQMFDIGAKTVVEKVLPALDNFERGLAGKTKGEDANVDGMFMIYEQLMSALLDAGVTPIEAEGKEFDPNFHNAVMQVENPDLESGTVAAELQKGYMYRDTVVRHSMVSVVQ